MSCRNSTLVKFYTQFVLLSELKTVLTVLTFERTRVQNGASYYISYVVPFNVI